MKLNCIHNGQPFTPQTTARDLIEDMDAELALRAEHQRDVLGGHITKMQVATIVKVLQRTDASVTRDMILDSLKPWEINPTYNALFNEPVTPETE